MFDFLFIPFYHIFLIFLFLLVGHIFTGKANKIMEAVNDQEKRKREIVEKLQILNEKKHNLVQVLKQVRFCPSIFIFLLNPCWSGA